MNKKQKRELAKAEAAKAATQSKKVENPVTAPKEPKAKKEPVSKEGKEKLNGETAKAVVKKITEKKDLKYKYPNDIDTLPKRKTFRAEVRRKLEAFRKSVIKLETAIETKPLKEDKVLLKKVYADYEAYSLEVLAAPDKIS